MRKFCGFIVLGVVIVGASSAYAGQAASQSGGRLSELVATLESANPEVDAARREIDMRAARVKPAGTPPDPVVSAAFMGGFTAVPFFPPSSNPNALREFGVSQELPYPGKLALRARVASVDTEVSRFAAEDIRLERIAEFRSMYMEFRLGDRGLAIIRRDNYVKAGRMRSLADLQEAVEDGAVKRIRPKMMTVMAILMGLLPIMRSTGAGADVMKRIAAPMVGGVTTSFVLELLIYPVIFTVWKWRGEVRPALTKAREQEAL